MGRKPHELTGQKFDMLKVLYRNGFNKTGHILWHCKCDCGNEKDIPVSYLVNYTGRKSCGCLNEKNKNNFGKFSVQNNICLIFDNTSITKIKNPKKYKNNQSGHVGVYLKKDRNKWASHIRFKKKLYHLGYYDKLEDAIRVREIAENEIFGEFIEWYNKNIKVKPNQIPDDEAHDC